MCSKIKSWKKEGFCVKDFRFIILNEKKDYVSQKWTGKKIRNQNFTARNVHNHCIKRSVLCSVSQNGTEYQKLKKLEIKITKLEKFSTT